MTTHEPTGKTWIPARQVRARYGGISDMTLWRWLHDDDMGFPKPRYINRRRYWREGDLDGFDRAQAEREDAEAA